MWVRVGLPYRHSDGAYLRHSLACSTLKQPLAALRMQHNLDTFDLKYTW